MYASGMMTAAAAAVAPKQTCRTSINMAAPSSILPSIISAFARKRDRYGQQLRGLLMPCIEICESDVCALFDALETFGCGTLQFYAGPAFLFAHERNIVWDKPRAARARATTGVLPPGTRYRVCGRDNDLALLSMVIDGRGLSC